MTRHGRRHRAFTLVELVATMVIISAASAVTASVISSASRSYADSARAATLHVSASSALDRIVKELQACPLDPAAPSPSPRITRVQRNSIDWGNGYRLTLNGRELRLTTPSQPAQPIVGDVSAFSVRTFNANNQLLPTNLNAASARAVRRIEITITLTSGRSSETIRTRIAPRALAIPQP